MLDLIIKRFEQPDEVREHEKGRFELITIAGLIIGRATYEPGWRWREHVGALTGTPLCEVEHVGLVLEGRAMVQMADGREVEMRPGDLFYVGPQHDSWVVGDERYVSLHFLGADVYAKADAEDFA